ncbi:hypothetical protein KOI35_37305 [Actinoplanes bogorensis]|uniref:Uncharacterized protein n=1 Tax=Paractinoplanes bogorensis TaxID=1610840 RepID=A0ABS5Z0G8_9ACTN|nr:hypothetical protein [Actinoplanes bogorensis]MBU2669185.1 hypothetical protein [Actinoplanes bogorensis]
MSSQIRALLLTIIVLAAVLVGIATVVLARLDGRSLPAAILLGGTAFGGTTALMLGVFAFAM